MKFKDFRKRQYGMSLNLHLRIEDLLKKGYKVNILNDNMEETLKWGKSLEKT